MLNLKVTQANDEWMVGVESESGSGCVSGCVIVGCGQTLEQATVEAAINLRKLLTQIRAPFPSPSEHATRNTQHALGATLSQ